MIYIQLSKIYQVNQTISKIEANTAKSILRGKTLFRKENCYNCHKVDKLICFGPRLNNLTPKYTTEFLINFIRNEDSLVKTKNPIVINLKEEYNWANGLHNKKHLSKRDVIDMLNYLNNL